MIGRLRELINRPVRELPAGALLVGCALVILVGAVALSLLDDDPAPAPRTAAQLEPSDAEVSNPPSVDDERGPEEAPSLDDPASAPVTRADADRVRRTAPRFLAGYLRFTYGRGNADEIVAATPVLRARLSARRPRVPAEVRRRRVRIVLVQTESVGELVAAASAIVDDGATRYKVPVRLRRFPSYGWAVTEVGP